jgi:glycosyltransferase involved in cell wall biosynthesis
LGLPLLEAQYGSLPVVAPDKPVFREVLGESGVFVDPLDPGSAASRMAALLASENWRERYAAAARDNIARWNRNASGDRARVVNFLAELARERADSQGTAGLTNSERHLR